jgi:hypothetical protein
MTTLTGRIEARPDLSVIVVNWNTKSMLRDCLESLFGSGAAASLEVHSCANEYLLRVLCFIGKRRIFSLFYR